MLCEVCGLDMHPEPLGTLNLEHGPDLALYLAMVALQSEDGGQN